MALESLFQPVISEGERALILLHMARIAYQEWSEIGGIKPDWDALSVQEKERWVRTVRLAVRAMMSLFGQVAEADHTKAA
jgi:hypothetical protein